MQARAQALIRAQTKWPSRPIGGPLARKQWEYEAERRGRRHRDQDGQWPGEAPPPGEEGETR